MNRLILFLGAVMIGSFSFGQGQCQANFTYSINGGTVDFTNASQGANLQYNWSFGDGNTSSSMNPSNTYTSTGNYNVCLTVYSQDSLGGFCQDMFCDSIYVVADSTGQNCQASFTYSINGSMVDFTNTSLGSNLQYNWTFGDGNTSTQMNPSNTYANTGQYNVCLTIYSQDSLGGFCQDSFCDSVFVVADSTGGNGGCDVSANVSVNANDMISGWNTSSGGSYYQWDVYDAGWNLLTSTSTTNLSYGPVSNGTYNVCLSAYDSMQVVCDSMCYQVESNDSTNSLFTISNVIEFTVYPNPAKDQVSINADVQSVQQLVVVDLSGREMTAVQVESETTTIDLINYPNGLYLIHALDHSGRRLHSEKLLKE